MMLPAAIEPVMADLVIEHYAYRYAPDGRPVIVLTVKNPSTEELRADLSVKVSRAVDTAQDEPLLKIVGEAKALRNVDFMPGKAQQVVFRQAPLLKPGDYEADIRMRHLADSKTHRIDFRLSQEAFAQAKDARESSKTASSGTGIVPTRKLAVVVIAGALLAAAITIGLKAGLDRLKSKRKRRCGP